MPTGSYRPALRQAQDEQLPNRRSGLALDIDGRGLVESYWTMDALMTALRRPDPSTTVV